MNQRLIRGTRRRRRPVAHSDRFTRGRWTNVTLCNPSTHVMNSSNMWLTPFPIGCAVCIDGLAFEVTTSAASTNCAVGVYDSNEAGPSQLITQTAAIASASTGNKSALMVPFWLTRPGIYWFAVASDGAPTLRANTYHNPFAVYGARSITTTAGVSFPFGGTSLPSVLDDVTSSNSPTGTTPRVAFRVHDSYSWSPL